MLYVIVLSRVAYLARVRKAHTSTEDYILVSRLKALRTGSFHLCRVLLCLLIPVVVYMRALNLPFRATHELLNRFLDFWWCIIFEHCRSFLGDETANALATYLAEFRPLLRAGFFSYERALRCLAACLLLR